MEIASRTVRREIEETPLRESNSIIAGTRELESSMSPTEASILPSHKKSSFKILALLVRLCDKKINLLFLLL